MVPGDVHGCYFHRDNTSQYCPLSSSSERHAFASHLFAARAARRRFIHVLYKVKGQRKCALFRVGDTTRRAQLSSE